MQTIATAVYVYIVLNLKASIATYACCRHLYLFPLLFNGNNNNFHLLRLTFPYTISLLRRREERISFVPIRSNLIRSDQIKSNRNEMRGFKH